MTKPELDKVAGALPTETEQANVAETLKAQVLAERKQRVAKCEAEVTSVLAKYNCSLDAAMILREGDIRTEIRIRANKE